MFYIKMEKVAILGLFYGEYKCSLSVKKPAEAGFFI